MKTTHQAIVVELNLKPHPNADTLSTMSIFDTYTVVTGTEQWNGKDRAVFVPVQNMVDTTRPEFSFLNKGKQYEEVKPVKLRGIHSQGLLVPCDQSIPIGTDVTELLGIIHVDHEANEKNSSEAEKAPNIVLPKYDIDSAKNYLGDIENEEVVVSVKVHGSNCSVYYDGKLHVRSRSVWQKEEDTNPYWYGVKNSNVPVLVKENPQYVVQGEIYGIQGGNFRYDLPQKVRSGFLVFDIKRVDGGYLDFDEYLALCQKYNVRTVDYIYRGIFDKKLFDLSVGTDYNTLREGIVIRPVKEKQNYRFNRVVFKVISPEFK